VQQLLEAEQATAVVISAIAGKAGVGKTALAVHVAHRLRPRFSDGQLYVNLRGTEAQARDPAEVLAEFLRALGVEGSAVPERLEERMRLFRAWLADWRVLVVLDNAASEAQVRPLLPGGPGCGVLVTSRTRLGGAGGRTLANPRSAGSRPGGDAAGQAGRTRAGRRRTAGGPADRAAVWVVAAGGADRRRPACGQASLAALGVAHGRQGRFEEAVTCLEQSQVLARATGDRLGEVYVLQSFGEVLHRQGRVQDAVGCLEQSLVLARAIGDRAVEAYALHTLGDVRRQQGRLEDAFDCVEHSLALFRDFGYRPWEARALNSLGMLLATRGDLPAGRRAWRGALAIFRELDMPEVAEVAARLDRQRW
jgi:tetratricopeptide (TPR) repeat protein